MVELGKQIVEHPMNTRGKVGIFKPKVYSTQCKEYQLNKEEHNNVSEALLSKNWRGAMEDEYKVLMRNGTWKLVPPLANQKVIRNKWVLRTKKDIERKVMKYKARLVERGLLQTPSVDIYETFSPVIKAFSLTIILALAI